MKLTRKMLIPCGSGRVSRGVAIIERGDSKGKAKDERWWSSLRLALVCELSCVNTKLFLETGLAWVVTGALLECPGMPLLTDAVVSTLLRLYSDPGVRTHQSHGDGGLRCWTCPCWSHPTLTCPTPKSRTGWSVPPLLCCPVSGAGQACSSSPPPSYLALLPFSHWWTLYLYLSK